MIEQWQLAQRIALPFEVKVELSKKKIREFNDKMNGKTYVAFSGGKDSTVLLSLVREAIPHANCPAVFCDTGVEYPEVRRFAKLHADITLRPKMTFFEVVRKYGWPVVSKETSQYLHECRTTMSMELLCKRLFGDGNHYRSGRLADRWRFLLQPTRQAR